MATRGGEEVQIVVLYAAPDEDDQRRNPQGGTRDGHPTRDPDLGEARTDGERRRRRRPLREEEEEEEEEATAVVDDARSGITVKKVVLPPPPRADPPADEGPPSVLRALLQASGKPPAAYPRTPDPRLVAEEAAIARTKDFGCQADVERARPPGSPEPPWRGAALSQIRALLVGETSPKRPRLERRMRRTQEHELSLFLAEVVDLVSEYKDLTYSIQSGRPLLSVEVRRKGLYGIPSPGLTPAQVVVSEGGDAHFLALLKRVMSTTCKDEFGRLEPERLRPLLLRLSIKGGHVFCPGVEGEAAVGALHTKNLVCVELCELRYQAKDCPVWYALAQHSSWLPLNDGVHKCKTCKALERYLLKKTKDKKETVATEEDDDDDDGGAGGRIHLDAIVESGNVLCVWESRVEPDGAD